MKRLNSIQRVWMARSIAMLADGLQILVFPAFMPGVLNPLNGVFDLAIGAVMIALVGWHIAFLPTFVAELLPFVDLVPSWTLAVLIVTRKAGQHQSLEQA